MIFMSPAIFLLSPTYLFVIKVEKIMAENVSYLDGMLEVPIIEGQSEDVCGQDDRYYAFGLWTDFCGLSEKEMRKAAIANAAGSSECCGSGGGGGGDTGDTGTTRTENVITITSKSSGGKYTITATAAKTVDVDVKLTIPYVILHDDGTTETKSVVVTVKKGEKTGSAEIVPSDGVVSKVKNDITVEPEESEKFEFTVKNDTDFKANSILAGTILYLDMEEYGLDILTYDILREFEEVNLTGKSAEVTTAREAEYEPNYRGQSSISRQHAYDFLFLIDADLDVDKLVVTDLNGIGEGEVVDLGETIGSVEYDDELYAAYRLSNPTGWSVVVGPGEEPIGYEWKYKIAQN